MSLIVTRHEWGARYGDGRAGARFPATELWLHHSATVAPQVDAPIADDYEAIRAIERIGCERFGEVYGFPYTFAITPSGRIFEGHDVTKLGAHTAGHNTVGRGICLVGDYSRRGLTPAQFDALVYLVPFGRSAGWWTVGGLTGGHRDTKATACPGEVAYTQIGEINRRIAVGVRDTSAPVRLTPALPTLRYGMREHGGVAHLQRFLRRVFPSYAGGLPDTGNYLEQTKAVVAEFQRRAGVDGPDANGEVVGPRTNAALASYGYRV
jgi:hypothetical protein